MRRGYPNREKKVLSLATVTTGPATSVTETSASVSGEVTATGNATVTERGICYGTDSLPTISDIKKATGTGLGAFSAILDNLAEGTKYHARAYATNSEGTAYGSNVSFTTGVSGPKTYKIGDIYEGGVIYYLDNDKLHGLAFADTSLGLNAWGCHGTEILGAIGVKIGDGSKNTADILKGCSDMDCAAKTASSLNYRGYTGWHLPSRDELSLIQRNWIDEGKTTKLPKGFYWASNQNNNNRSDMAQKVDIGTDGSFDYESKDIFNSIRVVAVKGF